MPRIPRKKPPQSPTQPLVTPAPPDDRVRETVVMFVDIMGASEVSNHKSPEDYATFVNGFQSLFRRTCKKFLDAWFSDYRDHWQYTARGDEGLLMIYRPDAYADASADIDLAINIALDLKRQWLYADENRRRVIDYGLLPIDLGIGIHTGRTCLDSARDGRQGPEENPGNRQPEGYAINLAKRVESHSRQGRFTHILLSESAHGHLSLLADESTYLFDEPQVITPKGFSRDIRVYELKHHFLPSDWREESGQPRRAKTFLDPDAADLKVIKRARVLNPTNLWLAEEFIRSHMLQGYHSLSEADRRNDEALTAAFECARQEATLLAQSAQRDAGVLFIQGLIEGECGQYEQERDRYQDAINANQQLAEAYWYKALSLSYQVFDELDESLDETRDDLSEERKTMVDAALNSFKQAISRRSGCAWMLFDCGCEIVRWATTEDQRAQGIRLIVKSVTLLSSVREHIAEQQYLSKVLDDPMIKPLLPTV